MSSIRVVVYDTPAPSLRATSAYYLRGVGPPSGPPIVGAEPHFVGRFTPAKLRVNQALWQYPALDRNALKAETGSYRFTFPPDALSVDFNRGSVMVVVVITRSPSAWSAAPGRSSRRRQGLPGHRRCQCGPGRRWWVVCSGCRSRRR